MDLRLFAGLDDTQTQTHRSLSPWPLLWRWPSCWPSPPSAAGAHGEQVNVTAAWTGLTFAGFNLDGWRRCAGHLRIHDKQCEHITSRFPFTCSNATTMPSLHPPESGHTGAGWLNGRPTEGRRHRWREAARSGLVLRAGRPGGCPERNQDASSSSSSSSGREKSFHI